MSRPQNPDATELGTEPANPVPPRDRAGTFVDLSDPLAVASLAEDIATSVGWKRRWHAMHLSLDEICAIARLAWAASFVVIAADPIGTADDVGDAASRAELLDALDNFTRRFLGAGGSRTVSGPDCAKAKVEDGP